MQILLTSILKFQVTLLNTSRHLFQRVVSAYTLIRSYTVLEKSSNEAFQALWVQIHQTNAANVICRVLYRQHNSPEHFLKYFEETVENLIATGKPVYVMTDANINLLHYNSCNYAPDFLLILQSLNSLRGVYLVPYCFLFMQMTFSWPQTS